MIRRSARVLGSFLTAYPQDPAVDQAGFFLTTALLELVQYQPTIIQGQNRERQQLQYFNEESGVRVEAVK